MIRTSFSDPGAIKAIKERSNSVLSSLEVPATVMSRMMLASLVFALVAVTGHANSSTISAVKAELAPVHKRSTIGGRSLQYGTWIPLTIKYSRINATEVQTLNVFFPMPDGRRLVVKFGIKHESDADTAPLQIKLYTKSSDNKDYNVDVTGSLNVVKVDGGAPYQKPFEVTFNTNNSDSEFYSLLGRDILADPAQGYYDVAKDELTVKVLWKF